MEKHEMILAIQGLQDVKGAMVQPYDVLDSYSVPLLQERLITLSPNHVQIDLPTAGLMLANVRRTNGCTYSPITKQYNPSTGYMVAMFGYEHVIDRIWNSMDLKHVLNFWLVKHGLNVSAIHWAEWNVYIGLWENDGKLYIDLSQHITADEKIAVELGKARNQISIWDCANKSEIKIA